MIYADYEYYATVYRGTALDEEQFCGLARKASAYVDYITMSRARSAAGDKLEAVQNCVCALAELEQDSELHLALVYRGTPENAAKFIEAQDALIEELYAEPDPEAEGAETEESEAADPTAESEATGE